jgi:capsule polysaccharide export protein KpsC/LpsZ
MRLKFKRRQTNHFVENNLPKNWTDKETPFVYYPLHSEPERAISIGAPYYTNQVEIVTHIAKSLPINYRLFVKDHPIMDLKGGRDVSFYKDIIKLPNVKLLHHNTDREKLLKKCSLVITITGTTGLEAAFYNKPTITFGETPYSKLSWIFRITNLEDLPKIIRNALKSKTDKNELRKYLSYLNYNSFNVDLNSIIASFGVHFQDNEINEKDIKEVLDENKENLQKIADIHVKKIQELKK